MSQADLVREPGPFATVLLDASHDTEDAIDLARQRWRAAAAGLADAGADEEAIAHLERAWTEAAPPQGRAGRLMVADRTGVRFDQVLPAPPDQPQSRYGALPYLLPALAAGQAPPHVVLVVDSTGMDYRVVTPDGTTEDTVHGEDHPVHKIPGGGWSHLSMQRRVEETIRKTMRTAAEAAVDVARGAGARLVAVAGEVQSRAALCAELPESLHPVELDAGSRAAGADERKLEAEVARALAEIDAADHLADLDHFRSQTGVRSVDGLPDVVAALAAGNAELLLMRPDIEGTAWTTPGSPELIGLGSPEPGQVECRLDECLPAAALAVAARVRVVGPEIDLRDGVGVLRRYG
ncbi:baeRF2 domain-containing protein [Actinokineospora sp. NPDC004072]